MDQVEDTVSGFKDRVIRPLWNTVKKKQSKIIGIDERDPRSITQTRPSTRSQEKTFPN